MNNNNFAQIVKEELANNNYNIEQQKAILSGFLRNASVLRISNNPSIHIKTELSSVAKLLFNSFKSIYNILPKFRYEKKIHFGKGTIYNVDIIDNKVYSILEELEVIDSLLNKIPCKKYITNKYFSSFLIGLFLACGSINNPSSTKTSYYLELSLSNYNDSKKILDKLLSFKKERTMSFKYIERRNKHVLYLKKSDQISVFLSYINAMQSMFEFENIRILKDELNNNNRINICDMANYARTIDTSTKDIKMLTEILSFKDINSYSLKEQAVINTRIKYPEANYRELIKIILDEYGITLSKSTLARILLSLRNEYEKLTINQ